jgi:DNA-binding transcriptional ArsR family regulator
MHLLTRSACLGGTTDGTPHCPSLTCDQSVTYIPGVMTDDAAFKALADPTRRRILDALRDKDGQSLSDLDALIGEETVMTRFGVMKHLKVLSAAGLVTTQRSGRQTLHYLNPVPIRLIHDRWISKYTEAKVAALSDLKQRLESS